MRGLRPQALGPSRAAAGLASAVSTTTTASSAAIAAAHAAVDLGIVRNEPRATWSLECTVATAVGAADRQETAEQPLTSPLGRVRCICAVWTTFAWWQVGAGMEELTSIAHDIVLSCRQVYVSLASHWSCAHIFASTRSRNDSPHTLTDSAIGVHHQRAQPSTTLCR